MARRSAEDPVANMEKTQSLDLDRVSFVQGFVKVKGEMKELMWGFDMILNCIK